MALGIENFPLRNGSLKFVVQILFFFFFFFLLFYLALNIKIRNFLNLNVEKLDKMGRGKELYSKF